MRADAVRRLLLGGFAVVVALTAFTSDALARKPWDKFKFPELGEVSIPDYERHVLDNGLVVYLLEDDKWPLVEGQIMVRTGAAFEPAEKVGLASVTGNVLRTGGTETVSADDLDAELERMGAYIESSIGNTSGSLSFSFLTPNASRGLQLVADVVRRPAFEQDKIDVALEGERAGVARRNDDLNSIASRELQQAVWGDEHPYARDTEYTTLDAINRDDVVGFYEYFYHPDNMMIAVWGDIDADAMLAEIQAKFGDWERGDVTVPDFPNEPMETQRKRVLVANKDDVNQTRVVMGHIGNARRRRGLLRHERGEPDPRRQLQRPPLQRGAHEPGLRLQRRQHDRSGLRHAGRVPGLRRHQERDQRGGRRGRAGRDRDDA